MLHYFSVSCIHADTTYFLNITCTLFTMGVILGRLDCIRLGNQTGWCNMAPSFTPLFGQFWTASMKFLCLRKHVLHEWTRKSGFLKSKNTRVSESHMVNAPWISSASSIRPITAHSPLRNLVSLKKHEHLSLSLSELEVNYRISRLVLTARVI